MFRNPRVPGVFWTGMALMVVGAVTQPWLAMTLYAVGGQELASSEVTWSLIEVSDTLLLPLGAALVVVSVVGRALVPVEQPQRGAGSSNPWPRQVSARTALWVGCLLVAVGLAVKSLLPEWVMSTAGSTSTLAYVVAYVMPVLTAVAIPIGVLLIPAAWVLRIIEGRSAAAPSLPSQQG